MGDELRFLLLGCRHFDDIPTRRGIGGEVIRHTCFGLTVFVTDLPIDITSTTGANSPHISPAISKLFLTVPKVEYATLLINSLLDVAAYHI